MKKIRSCFGVSVALGMFLFLNALSAEGNKMVFFPGETSEIASPSGRYILFNVDYDQGPTNHTLFLKDTKSKKEEKLLSYNRSVGVLWSPKGTALIVNDYGGSDYANSLLYSFKGREKKLIDLEKILRQKMGDNKSIFGNDHVYVESVKWLSENKVKIKISGHGDIDPNGFTLWYEYTFGDGFKSLKKNK